MRQTQKHKKHRVFTSINRLSTNDNFMPKRWFDLTSDQRFERVYSTIGKSYKAADQYVKKSFVDVAKWIKADPPRAAYTGLAAYHAYHGYQGGYIPYQATEFAFRAYDRKKPRRKRFVLRAQQITPSNRYLRRERYRYKQSQGFIPYNQWKQQRWKYPYKRWRDIRTPPRLKRGYYTRRTPPRLQNRPSGLILQVRY